MSYTSRNVASEAVLEITARVCSGEEAVMHLRKQLFILHVAEAFGDDSRTLCLVAITIHFAQSNENRIASEMSVSQEAIHTLNERLEQFQKFFCGEGVTIAEAANKVIDMFELHLLRAQGKSAAALPINLLNLSDVSVDEL